ncbi:MAG: hypothetical protein LW853_06285 [Rickettsiales bacterium]|jgi:hypothetical protein|nr:hypothetical protein [Rickettsiales bacterium]
MPSSQHHQDTNALEDILRDKAEELQELIQAIKSGSPDVAILLAQLLEGEPEAVRAVVVEKLRDIMETLDAEKATALEQVIAAQQQQQQQIRRNIFERWLAWVMSEQTRERIRIAFLSRPIIEMQVKDTGAELARRGVLGMSNVKHVDKRELGQLNANISASLGQGKDQGKGRG